MRLAICLFALLFQQGPTVPGRTGAVGGGGGGSAPTFVQVKDNATAAAVSTLTVTFGSNVAASNSIICMVAWSGAATFTSLQDGTSANFTAVTPNGSDTSAGTTKTYWLPSSAGGASASAITITISAPSSGSDLNIICHEWHGATTLDVDAIQPQSFPGTATNAVTSGSVTTTGGSGDGCSAFTNNNGGTSSGFSAGTTVAWASQANPGRTFFLSESFSQSAAGAIAGTFTSTAGAGIVIQTAIVCIK